MIQIDVKMKIAVLGTGMVGNAIGTKLIETGHQVMMGSRTPDNIKALEWTQSCGLNASQGTFADAAAFGEIIFNCTKGESTIEALRLAGEKHLAGKILVDLANALDFSKGMPPSLLICNTDSLGETIQREFPGAKVVKTLNTMNCQVMVNPGLVNGEHDIFVCGNDSDVKTVVKNILTDFGWRNIIDLGDISASRATEQLLPVWIRLMGTLGTPVFNFHVAR
jgi:predicted dinucleotide-binding enzyme